MSVIHYNTYSLHIDTSNASFLKMHLKLKKMGIKNNDFFLRLYDVGLKDYNPHDKNLPDDIKNRMLVENIINPWYFFREAVRIPEDGGVAKFRLDLASLTYIYLMLNNISMYVVAPRQTGKTISVLCGYVYAYEYKSKRAKYQFMNKDASLTRENLSRFRGILNELPEFMQGKHPNDISLNQTEAYSVIRENKINALAPATDETAAIKKSRGMTSSVQLYDEFAFTKYNEITFGSAIHAFLTASENAAKNGMFYGINILTTPESVDVPSGKYAKYHMDIAAKWHTEMLDWTIDELKEYIKKESGNIFIHVQYAYTELVDNPEEYKASRLKAVGGKMRNFKQEVLLVWPESFENSPFTEEEFDSIFTTLNISPTMKMINYSKFEIYRDIDITKVYAIGSDVGGGLGGDASTLVITESDTSNVAAIFKSNKITTTNFQKLVVYVMREWLPNSFLVMERNNFGLNIMQNLSTLNEFKDIRKRLFYQWKEDTNVVKKGIKKNTKTKMNSDKTKEYGLQTTGENRPMYFDTITDLIRTTPERITSNLIYSELKTLEFNGTRINHMAGKHDDVLFGYMLALYALTHVSEITNVLISEISRRIKFSNLSPYQKRMRSETNNVVSQANSSKIHNSKKNITGTGRFNPLSLNKGRR